MDLGGDAPYQGGHLGGGGVVHGSLGNYAAGVDHNDSCYSFVMLKPLESFLKFSLALITITLSA